MKLYAEAPRYRARQLLKDAATIVWIIAWVRIGMFMNDLVNKLGAPGETVEDAGRGFAQSIDSFGGDVADLPVIGDALQEPFETIAGAGRSLQQAGAAQQEAVQTLAFWLGLLLALIPITYVLMRYLPERLKWIREAGAADKLRIDAEDYKIFAIRALANQPLYELRRAAPDPAGAYAAGDYEPLAQLELAQMGLEVRRA
ncbi:MAG: hypothetical protein M3198_11450 [Actinomycetota bacterium]|nr:hypothetical protein [Actinomycetota bacterium]